MSTQTVTIPLPTAEQRQNAAAYLRHLADRIEAEDRPADVPGPRLRIDWASIEVDREWFEPTIYEAFPLQRLIRRLDGETVALRLHWRMG